MKSLLYIVCTLLVVGCTTVPVVQKFPSAPDTLAKPAPVLKEIPAGSSASQIFDIVIDNYGTYNFNNQHYRNSHRSTFVS